MAEPNPFSSLIMTPDNLSGLREAQFDARSEGQGFWVQEAGRAGLSMRRNLLARGIAMSPEDERAIATHAIMQGSQKRLADLVQSGELDPLDAQELVLNETMSAFMQAGDYESARSLLPGLNQIRTYRLEQGKLRSEIGENVASAESSRASAAKSTTEAAAVATKLPFETGKLSAETGAARGSEAERFAHARLYDRTDPNIRASKAGSGASQRVGPAEQREVREGLSGTLNLFTTMNDLIQMVEQAPWVTSSAAEAHTGVQQFLTGTNKYMSASGKGREIWNIEDLSSDPAQGRDGSPSPRVIVAQNDKKIRQAANKLGVDVTVFRSAVINAAYALARANDPGGRLSNNDFDFALQMLGAAQDPAAARAAFSNLARQAYNKHKDRMKSLGSENVNELFQEQNEEVESTYKAFVDRYGKLGVPGGSKRPSDIEAILKRHQK